jgi:hypothetical protein
MNCGKDVVGNDDNLMYSPGICLPGLRKIIETSVRAAEIRNGNVTA